MTIPPGTETEVPVIHSLVEAYSDLYDRILPTGSRVICPEAVTSESDEDYLMLVPPSKYLELEERLRSDGWVLGGSLPNGSPELLEKHVWTDGKLDMTKVFHSWKKDTVSNDPSLDQDPWAMNTAHRCLNVLITCNQEYFDDFTRATFLSERLGLTNKEDRVIVFRALCQDEWPSGEGPSKTKTGRTLRVRLPNDFSVQQTANLVSDSIPISYDIVYNTNQPASSM